MTRQQTYLSAGLAGLLLASAWLIYVSRQAEPSRPVAYEAPVPEAPANTEVSDDIEPYERETGLTFAGLEEAGFDDETGDADGNGNDAASPPSSTEKPVVPETAAFSKRLPELLEQRLKNSDTFLTREDLAPELQQRLDQAVESHKRNGYLDTNEVYIEQMLALQNEIVPIELDDPTLMVELNDVSQTPLSDLEYIGVVPDRIPGQVDMPIPGVRRLFRHEAGDISLYEGNLGSSGALLQKEFVNQSVKGYPATQVTYCAPSERCVTQLLFLTEKKRYELTFSGDLEKLGDEDLLAIANTLDLPVPPQQVAKVQKTE